MEAVNIFTLYKEYISHYKPFAMIVAVLTIIGLFMIVAITGHRWLGLALIFFAALMVFYPLSFLLPSPTMVRVIRTVVTVAVLIGFGYFCVVEYFIIRDARTDQSRSADYLIVLGAGVNGTTPSLSLHDRLVGTYDYLTEHPDCIAVVSGGQGPGEDMTEAQCMYDWLVARGIAPHRILMEDKATSTLENLRFSMDIITAHGGEDAIIGVLSSEYHLHRAKRLAEYVGIDAVGVAARTSYPTLAANYFIREAFAMTELYVFGAE